MKPSNISYTVGAMVNLIVASDISKSSPGAIENGLLDLRPSKLLHFSKADVNWHLHKKTPV